ncbi:hypothetical protein SERLA73DRAFT_147828 [Serpula lacrymans var. lacrymans S7.3]|uniref:Uncharacterized protein n=2 Tax=Serpula lacrymans var. lacrymans TaxID=341189 RepID=F8QI40_SERL3|nr:uncharacterized protein SERLADRAFT_383896 [Serpula lacrymans var. lacrymans S7.9]EGN92051.1 hypothetical protein SERLA73DRAFT_147828 [Serpula lacrymans var. lacrymans S7.3]EGO27995.1 hypothetical protein SERLADRAFT_383896 [Serpula lacrymans var. lacrymans S7.9]
MQHLHDFSEKQQYLIPNGKSKLLLEYSYGFIIQIIKLVTSTITITIVMVLSYFI